MTMATYTPIPQASTQMTPKCLRFSGDRASILEQLEQSVVPAEWGPTDTVRDLVASQVPAGVGWHGTVTVTGYRTPPNDEGTGTTYVSVHWEPANKGKDGKRK